MKSLEVTAIKLKLKAKKFKKLAVGVERIKYSTMAEVLDGIANSLLEVNEEVKDIENNLSDADVQELIEQTLNGKPFNDDIELKIEAVHARKFGALKQVPPKKARQSRKNTEELQ